MCTCNFIDDFKRDAVAQITERGYPIKAVSEWPGVSLQSLYTRRRKFAEATTGKTEKMSRSIG